MPLAGRAREAGALAAGVAFVLALCGCSNDPADLIGKPAQDSGAMASAMQPEPEEPPWLPALPDEDRRDACEACAKRECVTTHGNCLEDDACTALLVCKAECWHPACLAECEADFGFSPWYDDHFLCAFGTCGAECGAGQNWGCVGEYGWPRAESLRLEVRLDFQRKPVLRTTLTPPVAVGAQARLCPDSADLECGFGSRPATVDSTNSVALEVAANAGLSAATDWVELESTELGPYGWRDRLYGQPLFRSAIVPAYPADSYSFRSLAGGGWLDPAAAWLGIGIDDCVGWPAVGVHHSLPDQPEANPCHFDLSSIGCHRGAMGYFSVMELDAAALGGPLRVRVERTDTSEVVAERAVYGRSEWRTQVRLYPRSREQ